ncbi:MAG TPA: hypothetical protein DDY13_05015 [Cytophagales bacterium]|nr:hypothetical protein [Cytophagales bacterium]
MAMSWTIRFKKLKNKHNAIGSNINELEHWGLNRCPDRTRKGFDCYVALAVTVHKLHKIGRELQAQGMAKEIKQAA